MNEVQKAISSDIAFLLQFMVYLEQAGVEM